MQQDKKKLFEKYLIGITGVFWVAGLLIAGCDSPYMPWVNGMGLLLFFGTSVLLGKFINSVQTNTGIRIHSKIQQQTVPVAGVPKKRKENIKIRYALEI